MLVNIEMTVWERGRKGGLFVFRVMELRFSDRAIYEKNERVKIGKARPNPFDKTFQSQLSVRMFV